MEKKKKKGERALNAALAGSRRRKSNGAHRRSLRGSGARCGGPSGVDLLRIDFDEGDDDEGDEDSPMGR